MKTAFQSEILEKSYAGIFKLSYRCSCRVAEEEEPAAVEEETVEE
ncbi:hypothetical protein HanIR_Chr14g0695261 [Helianthus annuus]|nr:hypothetical protein HanIR_Chr14g0695261 [Helianthus annuus]